MKRVLLLATTTGYQTRSFGEAARKLGVQLVFATDRCDQLEDPWWDQAIPIRFHEEDQSVRAILDATGGDPLAGVLAVGDRPTRLAARVADRLNLPGNPLEAADASRNKWAFRTAISEARLPGPWFRALPIDTDPAVAARDLSYPCVIKPLALSGSRGVIRADDAAGFVVAFARVRRLLASADVQAEREPSSGAMLVEGFIPGREFALEGLLQGGRLRTLAIFDKPDPLDGPFFEETIYVTPSGLSDEDQARVGEAVAAAAGALGLRHGPVHAECRVNDAGVFVLEVAARPIGGLCSRALRFVTKGAPRAGGSGARDSGEASLEEVLLRHALGGDVEGYVREPGASGVMMIPIPRRGVFRGVSGLDAARAVKDVEDVHITAKVDQVLVPLPEGKSYLGFIFARSLTPDAVVGALREAHARLAFTIERALM